MCADASAIRLLSASESIAREIHDNLAQEMAGFQCNGSSRSHEPPSDAAMTYRDRARRISSGIAERDAMFGNSDRLLAKTMTTNSIG